MRMSLNAGLGMTVLAIAMLDKSQVILAYAKYLIDRPVWFQRGPIAILLTLLNIPCRAVFLPRPNKIRIGY